MSCNCNTADPNCEPCAFCTPPGVVGLPVCKPEDPCDGKKINLNCTIYSGDDYACYGIYNGAPLYNVLFNLLGRYFVNSNCCSINGVITLPTTTTTSTTSTTSTSTTTTTTASPTTTTSTSTTSTTTLFSCTCNYYDVTNPSSGDVTLTYTACNNGYTRTTTVFGPNSTTRVCACSDILLSIPRGVTVINSGIRCTSTPINIPTTTTSTTTVMPCKCYRITATNKTNVTWVDCNGITQTGQYNINNPYYCSPYLSFNVTGYSVITGGTTNCINQLCPTTTTTTATPTTSTTSTTTIPAPCVPDCGVIYMTGNNSNLYFYNLAAGGTSTQIPNPTNAPVGAYGDIAHTSNQFFVTSNVGDPFGGYLTAYSYINIYDISTCPFRFSTVKKTLTTSAGQNILGLTVKSTNTLISCQSIGTSVSNRVVEIDTSGTSAIFTVKFTLSSSINKVITGDLYYSAPDNYLYITTQNATNTTRWISKYNYSTGVLVSELDITSYTTSSSTAYGIAAINNDLYIFLSSGRVYRVDNMTTLVQMPWGNPNIGAASTAPGCLGLTTTTTTLSPCNCLTFVSSNTDPSTYQYTDCFGVIKTGTIGGLSTLKFCGVPGSATFGREGITATTGYICYDRITCPVGPTTTTTTGTPTTTTTTTINYTTTTSTTRTTSTTTTSTSTTTTTTATPCVQYTITRPSIDTPGQYYSYIDCNNVLQGPIKFNVGLSVNICAIKGSIIPTEYLTVTGGTINCSSITTTSTTNPYVNKYYATKYGCIIFNGCSKPLATNVIVTVQNNTLTVGKYYLAVGDTTGVNTYQITGVALSGLTASVVLNKTTETSTCIASCNYYNPNA